MADGITQMAASSGERHARLSYSYSIRNAGGDRATKIPADCRLCRFFRPAPPKLAWSRPRAIGYLIGHGQATVDRAGDRRGGRRGIFLSELRSSAAIREREADRLENRARGTPAAAGQSSADPSAGPLGPTIRIATFQLGRLDEAKLANRRVSDVLVHLLPRFDLIALQGVRGKNQGRAGPPGRADQRGQRPDLRLRHLPHPATRRLGTLQRVSVRSRADRRRPDDGAFCRGSAGTDSASSRWWARFASAARTRPRRSPSR